MIMTHDIQLKQRKDCGDWHSLRVFIRPGGLVVRRNVLTCDEGRAELFGPRREFCGRYYCQLQTVITFEEIKMILRFLLTHPGWLWRKWRAVKRYSKIEQA
jgi:hypothetical protein